MNLWEAPAPTVGQERSDALIFDKGVLIERIISNGHVSPAGFWYDQDRDEWVALLQGQAQVSFADGRREKLCSGDWLFIPAHERHRVEGTSTDPPCIWLAVHGHLK
jgi:cupin 2 domain-containing protein